MRIEKNMKEFRKAYSESVLDHHDVEGERVFIKGELQAQAEDLEVGELMLSRADLIIELWLDMRLKLSKIFRFIFTNKNEVYLRFCSMQARLLLPFALKILVLLFFLFLLHFYPNI